MVQLAQPPTRQCLVPGDCVRSSCSTARPRTSPTSGASWAARWSTAATSPASPS